MLIKVCLFLLDEYLLAFKSSKNSGWGILPLDGEEKLIHNQDFELIPSILEQINARINKNSKLAEINFTLVYSAQCIKWLPETVNLVLHDYGCEYLDILHWQSLITIADSLGVKISQNNSIALFAENILPLLNTPQKIVELQKENNNNLKPRGEGWSAPYTYPTRRDDSVTYNFNIPLIYDASTWDCNVITNKNKKVVRYELKELVKVDYARHDVAQYFPKQRSSRPTIDEDKTLRLLAEVQKEAYIAEKLAELDPFEDDEGKVSPSDKVKEYKLGQPLEIAKTIVGTEGKYDYSLSAIADVELPELFLDIEHTVVVNYEHVSFSTTLPEGDIYNIVIKLRDAISYTDILKVLEDLDEIDGTLANTVWQNINERSTRYVNNILTYRFGMDFEIESFYIDFIELEDLLLNEYGIAGLFSETASDLFKGDLRIWSNRDELFTRTFGLSEDDDYGLIGFATLSDVTILPIRSDDINIPVPIPKDAEADEKKLTREGLVTESSYRELYRAIEYRVHYARKGVSRIVFCTSDGQFFYIHKTNNDKSFIISSRP